MLLCGLGATVSLVPAVRRNCSRRSMASSLRYSVRGDGVVEAVSTGCQATAIDAFGHDAIVNSGANALT